MLQAALLLPGRALSQYLWDVNTTIASVVLGVASLGFLCYLFVAIAGAFPEICQYSTPRSSLVRYLIQKVHSKPRKRLSVVFLLDTQPFHNPCRILY